MPTEQQEHLKIEQQAAFDPNDLEVAAGREREDLQGWIPTLASDAEIREALEKAFDYRGDVTLTRRDGTDVEGYLFDRRTGPSLETSVVRIIPTGAKTKVSVLYSEVGRLAFTGRDTAAGKSFEAWIKRYWEKKAAGEKNIQIEPEKLD